jgi:glucokinase
VHGLTGSHITQAAQAGDSVALAALNTTGQWLGAGISSLAMILNPAVVVISGGAIAAGELLLAPAREMALRKLPFRGKHPETQIVAATLGNQAGLVGASDLARQK